MQLVPDAILDSYVQDYINKSLQYSLGTHIPGVGLPNRDRQTFRPDQIAQHAVLNQGAVLASPQYQIARDYSLRASGIAPDTAHQGAPTVTYGGRTFLNTRGRDLGSFNGDVSAYGTQLSNFVRGNEALRGMTSAGQSDKVRSGNFQQVTGQYGDISFGTGVDLASKFGTLSGAQRDQVLSETGLSSDQLLGFEQRYRQAGQRFSEVKNIQDVGEGERVLRGSIQQAQVNNGLFSSQAGAAAEASAVAAYSSARQENLNSTLLGGALDPTKIKQGGATASQEEAQLKSASILPRLLGSQLGAQSSVRAPTPGMPLGLIDYTQTNPLKYLENPAIALYGALGAGSIFG